MGPELVTTQYANKQAKQQGTIQLLQILELLHLCMLHLWERLGYVSILHRHPSQAMQPINIFAALAVIQLYEMIIQPPKLLLGTEVPAMTPNDRDFLLHFQVIQQMQLQEDRGWFRHTLQLLRLGQKERPQSCTAGCIGAA